MKYIIAGGRNFNNRAILEKVCNSFTDIDTVISGCAQGADTIGAEWAAKKGIALQTFPAYWDVYGKSAGFIRNAEMGEHADCAIVFWDGKSKGSKHMIKTMKYLRKQCYVYDYNGKLYDPNNSRSNS